MALDLRRTLTASGAGLGRLRRRLVLEQPVEVTDGAGGATRSFAPVVTVWANMVWLGGDERWQQGRPEQAASLRITLRWRAGVTAGMRLVDGARMFDIRSVGDPDGARHTLVCLCEEISP